MIFVYAIAAITCAVFLPKFLSSGDRPKWRHKAIALLIGLVPGFNILLAVVVVLFLFVVFIDITFRGKEY